MSRFYNFTFLLFVIGIFQEVLDYIFRHLPVKCVGQGIMLYHRQGFHNLFLGKSLFLKRRNPHFFYKVPDRLCCLPSNLFWIVGNNLCPMRFPSCFIFSG